jgi:hypothetical protein
MALPMAVDGLGRQPAAEDQLGVHQLIERALQTCA